MSRWNVLVECRINIYVKKITTKPRFWTVLVIDNVTT